MPTRKLLILTLLELLEIADSEKISFTQLVISVKGAKVIAQRLRDMEMKENGQ
jgi:hypothetical protein